MSIEPSVQAIKQTPQSSRRRYPLLSIAEVAIYFCWPVATYFAMRSLSNLGALEYGLLAASALLWWVSAIQTTVLLFETAIALWPVRLNTAAVAWLLGWPLLVIAAIAFQYSSGHPDWLMSSFLWYDLYLGVPGTILWWGACRRVYDALFTAMETRWPGTKGIRELVSGLLRSLLHHHHSS